MRPLEGGCARHLDSTRRHAAIVAGEKDEVVGENDPVVCPELPLAPAGYRVARLMGPHRIRL